MKKWSLFSGPIVIVLSLRKTMLSLLLQFVAIKMAQVCFLPNHVLWFGRKESLTESLTSDESPEAMKTNSNATVPTTTPLSTNMTETDIEPSIIGSTITEGKPKVREITTTSSNKPTTTENVIITTQAQPLPPPPQYLVLIAVNKTVIQYIFLKVSKIWLKIWNTFQQMSHIFSKF